MRTSIIVVTVIFVLAAFVWMLPTPETEMSEPETAVSGQLASPSYNTFRLQNITLFDGQSWHEKASIVVVNGRIGSDEEASETIEVIDGQVGYVIPGLIDAHTHSWGTALEQALRFGVTTELDMFTSIQFMQEQQRDRNELKRTVDADLFSAGTLVTSEGGHGTQYGMDVPTIASPEQAVEFVDARLAEGSDFIKIVYDAQPERRQFGMSFTSIDFDTLQAVIAATHQRGKLAVVHIMDPVSAADAVNAGADGLVHTFAGTAVSSDLIQLLKSNEVFVIPTLSVLASIGGQKRGEMLVNSGEFSEYVTPTIKRALTAEFGVRGMSANYIQSAIDNTRKMHEAGIRILAGTDAPNPGTDHGISMHDELALLVESGMSPTQALQSASSLVHQSFNIGTRGHLKPGARADFILLQKDPRQDITHTRTIKAVFKNGFSVVREIAPQSEVPLLSETGLVSHFENADLTPVLGSGFIVSTDEMMQGNSTAQINWVAEGCLDPGALQVSGTIGGRFPYPWSGTFLMLSQDIQQGQNISNFSHIRFQAMGYEGPLRLMVINPVSQQPSEIQLQLSSECQQFEIPFSDFPDVDWGNISGIGWVAGAATPEFSFQLDNIELR